MLKLFRAQSKIKELEEKQVAQKQPKKEKPEPTYKLLNIEIFDRYQSEITLQNKADFTVEKIKTSNNRPVDLAYLDKKNKDKPILNIYYRNGLGNIIDEKTVDASGVSQEIIDKIHETIYNAEHLQYSNVIVFTDEQFERVKNKISSLLLESDIPKFVLNGEIGLTIAEGNGILKFSLRLDGICTHEDSVSFSYGDKEYLVRLPYHLRESSLVNNEFMTKLNEHKEKMKELESKEYILGEFIDEYC